MRRGSLRVLNVAHADDRNHTLPLGGTTAAIGGGIQQACITFKQQNLRRNVFFFLFRTANPAIAYLERAREQSVFLVSCGAPDGVEQSN